MEVENKTLGKHLVYYII